MKLCVSHVVTNRLMNNLGTNHDSKVLEWRDALVTNLTDATQQDSSS